MVRNIGCYLDTTLCMSHHIGQICRTCYFHIFRISKIRHLLDKKTSETLVHAYTTSRLDCFNCVLYGISNFLLSKLQRVQNAAARLITRTKRQHSITPVLFQLHWLPVRYRITYKILLLVFRILHCQAPEYLISLISRYQPPRTLRSSDTNLLTVPRSKMSTCGYRAFSHAGPQLWNSLPLILRSEELETVFKKGYFVMIVTDCVARF